MLGRIDQQLGRLGTPLKSSSLAAQLLLCVKRVATITTVQLQLWTLQPSAYEYSVLALSLEDRETSEDQTTTTTTTTTTSISIAIL